jgi:hypothetical protein
MANNAKLPDINTIIQAGINPKTGLPVKMSYGMSGYKGDFHQTFGLIDRQDAINRYQWFNLPAGITQQMIETVLYFKGQGAFFYMETLDKFFFLPYALDGSVDVYGRYMGITPLPFAGGTTSADEKEKPWIDGLHFTPSYEIILPDELTYEDLVEKCVLLHDYAPAMCQTIAPRASLQQPILDIMSDIVPFLRTSLLNATGVQGMRVQSEDEQSNVESASNAINRAGLVGQKWVPIVGSIDFQTLTDGVAGRAEEFLMSLESLDNLRLSMYGIENGGIFQKKAHMLQAEQMAGQGTSGLVLQDGLTQRQQFCDIINSIWGLGIWVENSEITSGVDKNMDGEISDSKQPMTQPAGDDIGGNDDVSNV